MAENLTTTISSEKKKVSINRDTGTFIIGERINPTGKKRLQKELSQGNFEIISQESVNQVDSGAALIDVNAGVPGADEPSLLVEIIKVVQEVTNVPLCIDTASPKALEAALKIYNGKALVNSVNGEDKKIETILPIIKEYGAAVIALTIDDHGIPDNVSGRLKILERIMKKADENKIPLEDVVADPLALSLGAEPMAGRVALDTIQAIVDNFGINVTMGCSNISFGLPDRDPVNAAFLCMAIRSGLSCPITDPTNIKLLQAVLAADLSMGRDENAAKWIKTFRKLKKQGKV